MINLTATRQTGMKITKENRISRVPMIARFLIAMASLAIVIAAPPSIRAQTVRDIRTIFDIPSPRANGQPIWCVDTTGQISAEATTHINQVCEEVHQRINKEMTVVVINTTHGQNHRQFGTDLFNHWGVGKWGFGGAFRNDGILMLVALDDRRAEIILGDGIDDDGKIRTAQQIIDDVVIPNFKADEGDSGIYEGIRTCATRLLGVTDLDSPVQLPSVSGNAAVRAKVRKQQRRGPITWWPWILGIGGIGGVFTLIGSRYYLRYRPRHCPDCQGVMELLREDQDDPFLDDPELMEENLGSVDYDVWACLQCEKVLKLRYGKFLTRYSRCPQCRYVTVLKIETTMVAATYSHGGRVRVVEDCKHCDFHRTYSYSTPKKVRSSSSSSGGSLAEVVAVAAGLVAVRPPVEAPEEDGE